MSVSAEYVDIDGVPIVEVARRLGLPVKREGGTDYIPCPTDQHEHDAKEPRCGLAKDRPVAHCLKCDWSGNSVQLVKAVRKCSHGEAADWIRTTFGLQGGNVHACTTNADALAQLAAARGWTIEAIKAVGAYAQGPLVVLPMFDDKHVETGRKRRKGDNGKIDGEHKSKTDAGCHNGLIGTFPLPADGPIAVCEGEADAVALVTAGFPGGVIATPGATPGEKVEQYLKRLVHGRNVVIFPQGDDASRKWQDRIGRSLLSVGCRVALISPGTEKDIDERLRGKPDKVAALKEIMADPLPIGEHRPRLLSVTEILSHPDRPWLVDSILHQRSNGALYGFPASGKSFVALDMSLSVALNRPWLKRYPVRGGPVIYVAAEGQSGLNRRLRDWMEHHGVEAATLDKANWWLWDQPVNLTDSADVEKFINAVSEQCKNLPVLIVLDTLARCMTGGDENAAKDMGKVVASIDRIRGELNCATLTIHHTGKDRKGSERGSSALRGAADVMLRCDRPDNSSIITVTCDKMKDAKEPEPIRLHLKVAESADSRGTSCVVELADGTMPVVASQAAAAMRAILAAYPDGLTSTEWEEQSKAAGIPHSTFDLARKAMVQRREVNDTEGKKGARYRLPMTYTQAA